MPKIRYEIDPHNRLIIDKSGKASRIKKYRKVVDGYFKIDKKSRLIYHVKKSSGQNIPQQVKLSGKWSLDRNHNLVLTLDKWGRQYAKGRLILKGQIIKATAGKLVFSLATKDKNGSSRIYILKFNGSWQVDKNNRITFRITKDRRQGTLSFYGAWKLNKNNQIVYSYVKRNPQAQSKSLHKIVFSGTWNIKRKFVLSYMLGGLTDSSLDFKVGLGVPLKRGNTTALRYKLGVGLSHKKGYSNKRNKYITLFGRWRLKKGVGLLFEIKYANGKKKAMIFSADVVLNTKDKLTFSLKNREGKGLGVSVTLSRTQLGGEVNSFIRFITTKQEKAVELGVGIRW